MVSKLFLQLYYLHESVAAWERVVRSARTTLLLQLERAEMKIDLHDDYMRLHNALGQPISRRAVRQYPRQYRRSSSYLEHRNNMTRSVNRTLENVKNARRHLQQVKAHLTAARQELALAALAR